MGLYANVLRSGGLSAIFIAVPVNLLRSGGQTIGAIGVYANMLSGGASAAFLVLLVVLS